MLFSWVTWVCTLGLTGPEFAFHRSRTKKCGVNVGFTHTKRSLAAKEILMLVVTCQSLLTTFCTQLREIPYLVKNLATTTRKVSLMLLRHSTPALIVVSVSGRTLFWTLSLALSREVLILLFLIVVTTPHHRCSVANMAWDPFHEGVARRDIRSLARAEGRRKFDKGMKDGEGDKARAKASASREKRVDEPGRERDAMCIFCVMEEHRER